MAILHDNYAMKGLRGKVGDIFVYRNFFGTTVVSKVPKMPASWSARQTKHRSKFSMAIKYGKHQMEKPEVKALYATGVNNKKRNPFLVATADYMNAPKIINVDTSKYSGEPGDTIVVNAQDDFKIHTVIVTILDSHDKEIEKGPATLSELFPDTWVYKTTSINAKLFGSKVLVSVSDLAGNVTDRIIPSHS